MPMKSDYPDFPERSGFFRDLRRELIRQVPHFREACFLLALSGGIDSMTLLCFLIWLRKRDGVMIKAAHFNHHLREKTDEQESDFLREFCVCRQVPLAEGEADVRALALERRAGIEEAARFARYRFLHAELERLSLETEKKSFLLLGHHRGDQAETVLLHLGRGSGLKGLGGMRYRNDPLLRPLLYTSRAEIEHFAAAQELSWCEDASNESGEYLRNRVRHELIPLWNDLLGYSLEGRLSVLADNIAEEEEALAFVCREVLSRCAVKENELNLKRLQLYPPAIRRRVIQEFLTHHYGDEGLLSREQFRQINETIGRLPAEASFYWRKMKIEIKRFLLTV